MKKTYTIPGQLINKKTLLGIKGLRIEAWSNNVRINDADEDAITDDKGYFKLRFAEATFREFFIKQRFLLYFQVFSGKLLVYSTLTSSGTSVDDLPPVDTMFLKIGSYTEPDALPGDFFTVQGKAINSKGEIIRGQQLMAYDVDLRGAAIYRTIKAINEIYPNSGMEPLGEASTDEKGNYTIKFYTWQFIHLEGGEDKADIIVYAVNKAGKILGRSRLVNAADYSSQGEINGIDISVADEGEKTEYDFVMDRLLPFLQENKVLLSDLAKSADQTAFAANTLGIPVAHIQLAVEADALATEAAVNDPIAPAIPAELFYGIGRQSIALTWVALYNQSDTELAAAIGKSATEKITRDFSGEVLSAWLRQLHHIASAVALEHKDETQPYSLEEMLGPALPQKAQQAAFVTAYRDFKSIDPGTGVIDYSKFWSEYLPQQPEFKQKPELIEALLLSQQLTVISGNHPPLVAALQQEKGIASVSSLVALGDNEWTGIITKAGVPDFIEGANEQERIASYTGQIQSLLYAAYPTQKIAAMVSKAELPIEDSNVAGGISTFLTRNAGFDFKQSKVQDFEAQIKEAAPAHFENVQVELKRMQRVFQVSTTPAAMKVLMENKLDAAHSIANMPKKSFLQMHGAALGGEAMAEAVYQRAEHISSLAAERSMMLYEVMNAPAPRHAYSPADLNLVRAVMTDKFPNYANLFGSPDICACEHCRSVYSAAAYMVDLLRFLWRGGKNEMGQSPLDKFVERRPDILHLPLTCENTNTIIPYIDLVNEVMEYYTVHDKLDDKAAHDTGKTTAAELRANPQYVEGEAYKILKNQVYPFSLPYHQPLDIIRTYSDQLKTERYEVMETMQTLFTDPAAMAIQAEVLRISEETFAILTGTTFEGSLVTRELHEYFGYNAPGELEQMAGTGVSDGIHEFLRRSGIKYTDLVELLKTRFINPHQYVVEFLEKLFLYSTLKSKEIYPRLSKINTGVLNPADDIDISIALSSRRSPISPARFTIWVRDFFAEFDTVITLFQSDSLCDLNTTYLRTIKNVYAGSGISGISDAEWSKIHRFIRLWRKLGWKMHELDLMLTALGETDITATTIKKLSSVVLLNRELKLPLDKLATLWGDIDTVGDKSIYVKLFLNKAVRRSAAAFEPDALGNYLADPAVFLKDHQSVVVAAFNISETDLVTIAKAAAIDLTTESLTIQHLSSLYRYTVLSKALKLKVPELCTLIRLFAVKPFNSSQPADTLAFCELAGAIKKAGFKVTLLQYIFEGTLPAESTLGLNNEKAVLAIRDISRILDEVDTAFPVSLTNATDPANLLRNTLLRSYNADTVDTLMGIVAARQTFDGMLEPGLIDVVPASLVAKYQYSLGISGKWQLHCKGIMTEKELRLLEKSPLFTGTVGSIPKPTIVIPDPLDRKYTYTKADGKITCRGIMYKTELTDLMALPGTNKDFKDAVTALMAVSDNYRNVLADLYTLSNDNNTAATETAVFTVKGFSISIPDSLAPKYAYIKATGRLSCRGNMSDDEKNQLTLLADALVGSEPADSISAFKNSLDYLYSMPTAFLSVNFNDVFPDVSGQLSPLALANLLNRPAQPVEKTMGEKQQYVYDAYVPTIRKKLREDAVVKHIALITGLSETAATLITKKHMNALLWIASAKRFSMAIGDSELGRSWEVYLSPPSSGEYTLRINIPTVHADKPVRLYLDGNLIQELRAGERRGIMEATVPLNAAQMHKLAIKYYHQRNEADIWLFWKATGKEDELIPVNAIFNGYAIWIYLIIAAIIHRAAKFILGFQLTEKELAHLIKYSSDFGSINFDSITPDHWKRINDYTSLRNAIPQAQALLTDVFSAAHQPAANPDALTALLQLATGWESDSLAQLVQPACFNLLVADFKNEIALHRLHKAILLAAKTGLSVDTLKKLGNPDPDYPFLQGNAAMIKNAVKAKYSEEDWLKLAGDLSDTIREHQKQALISHLLTKTKLKEWGVRDADELFEYFLIDVQMGACMDTSRIVQANAAIQMYVNRCLLNLEGKMSGGYQTGVSPDYIDKDRWEWMKYYRVWEVNRMIFTTPENSLKPEWRDDKSPFFKELESELTQNDITDRNVETAFRDYLAKLNTVANLDVCGMYQENDEAGKMKLLHVFGRTHNAPYQFFYRTCSAFYKWTAWEKVQVDIRVMEDGDNSGVHLVPVVWKNRLLIFWTEYIEKQEPNSANNAEKVSNLADKTLTDLKSSRYWEMRLAWSEYVDGKWTPKQLSKEFIKVGDWFKYVDNRNDRLKSITFKTEIREALFIIPFLQVDRLDGQANGEIHANKFWNFKGFFMLTDIQAQVIAANYGYNKDIEFESGKRYYNNFQKHHIVSGLRFWGNSYLRKVNDYNLLYSNSILEKEVGPKDPFFYSDVRRTYFVRPVDVEILPYILAPQLYAPHQLQPASLRISAQLNTTAVPASFTAGRAAANSPAALVKSRGTFTAVQGSAAAFGGNFQAALYFKPTITKTSFEFHTFYHPFSSQLVTNLNQGGIKELMASDTLRIQKIFGLQYNDGGNTFQSAYNPNFSQGYVIKAPISEDYIAGGAYTFYKENICFDVFGANSIYNWELFFHAPLYIATRLSKNGKYEEAMNWFHYIFDPTTDEMPLTGQSDTSRYWKTLPFKTIQANSLEKWFLELKANGNTQSEEATIAEWRESPLNAYTVARNRPIAFMKNVVIEYVENLRQWGDSLFRMFTRESVNEALQLYVIANHILGPRPEFVPKRGEIKAETYQSLSAKLDDFSNALVEMENAFPYSSSVSSSAVSRGTSLTGIGKALYFCIPPNKKLMEHWDTIADRLYKIRHCMDIDGVERHLALFSPPIDPAALINAAAQGLSLGSILSDLSSPPPIYRFSYLVQKANEFCNEVKSLGGSLLAAAEKLDGAKLERLRSTHESTMLELMTGIKERQILDAKLGKEGLLKSRETAAFRFEHYNALMSSDAITLPAPPSIEADLNADSQLPADSSIAKIENPAADGLVDSGEKGVAIIQREKDQMELAKKALIQQQIATGMEGLAGILNMIPNIKGAVKPFGIGAGVSFGGSNLGAATSALAKVPQMYAAMNNYRSSHAGQMAGYIRRQQDWALQANLAAREIIQLDKQITSADIKIQLAQKELANHKQQMENTKQVEQFLKDKFSNQELYQWMKEQLFSVYKESYNMAYDMAKKAEKCYQYELGKTISNFITYGYWDSSMQGLVSGEKLQLALRQMEKSYIEENKRDLELTKAVSMALLNPLALQELRTSGKCFLSIPEELYDLDYQGHYFRRIKSVSISLPCIAGPYTTVNCTLRLLKNTVRINTNPGEQYEHANEGGVWLDDDRFRENNVPVKSIATSTGQRDSGMFELNFRDERYLPFEGAGAISEWKIELTQDADLRQFDYSTIADVILHINYTAREDAGLFKASAVEYLKKFLTTLAELSPAPLMRMFSIRHDFPNEWHGFLHPAVAGADQALSLTLRKDHFPFFVKDRAVTVGKIDVLMKTNRAGDYEMLFTPKNMDGDSITVAVIPMPENTAFANMQKGTITIPEDMDAFKPMVFKFTHNSDASDPKPYNQIDTNPDEVTDLFIVLHYKLGD